ncbi:hypothetical protein ACP70R_016336 [Stipagrostis hirtigluma subsp. patula]
MATAMRSASLLRLGFRHVSTLLFQVPPSPTQSLGVARAGLVRLRCSAAGAGDDGGKRVSARLALTQQVLRDAEERAASAGSDPAPKITLDHVTVNFARSGGPGGQNVNKGLMFPRSLVRFAYKPLLSAYPNLLGTKAIAFNTKVDMRFNVKEAHWLGERIKERILQTEKNRGNIEDALQKIQAIIDAASYVPPPPTEEQKKKIEKIAAAAERKRLQKKKVLSQKKEFRRNRTSWD